MKREIARAKEVAKTRRFARGRRSKELGYIKRFGCLGGN